MPLAYDKGELVDRFAIELRKNMYGAQNGEKIKLLADAMQEHKWSAMDVVSAISNAISNADIANLEWAVRSGLITDLAEIGLRAQRIRDINAQRNHAKDVINESASTTTYGYGEEFNSRTKIHIVQPVEKK